MPAFCVSIVDQMRRVYWPLLHVLQVLPLRNVSGIAHLSFSINLSRDKCQMFSVYDQLQGTPHENCIGWSDLMNVVYIILYYKSHYDS